MKLSAYVVAIALGVTDQLYAAEAQRVTVSQLLAHPAEYHGRTVIVNGIWNPGFERSDFFERKDPKAKIYLEDVRQDTEKPDDKKLLMLQQLYAASARGQNRSDTPFPIVKISEVELEMEAEFFDWESLESTKTALREAEKSGSVVVGGFGHLGSSRYKLVVKKVLSFRARIESPADSKSEGDKGRTSR